MNEKLELLKGAYIKCENREHGRQIIEFFKKAGAKNPNLRGDTTDALYGVAWDGYIECIDNEKPLYPLISPITLEEARKLVEEKTFPRKMYVSDNDPECGGKRERIVLWENPFGNPRFKFHAVEFGMENDFAIGKDYGINLWKFAKDIEVENPQKQELLNKADELIQKANELKQQAEKL
jgi:hypothetical protein